VVIAQLHGGVSAEGGERRQLLSVASRRDDLSCPQPSCDLHGHRAGVPGGAEDEHALAGGDRHAPAQRDPRGHRRVHRRSELDHVDAGGQLDRAAHVDHGALGQRSDDVIVGCEVDQRTVAAAADAVDSGDHRQRSAAGVVRAAGAATHARVQSNGKHVDEDPVLVGNLRHVELLVVGRLIEARDHRGIDRWHATSVKIVRITY
jgi:hypothetical protein